MTMKLNKNLLNKSDIESILEPTLLWENSSPSSSFNPSDYPNSRLTLSQNKNNFSYLKILISLGAGNNIFQIVTLENTSSSYSTTISMGDGNVAWGRTITFVDSTHIEFGNGVNGSTTNNNRIVFKAIYGTNIL